MSANHAMALGLVAFLAAAVAFGVYRWIQNRRKDRIRGWIASFLLARYGQTPRDRDIHCTHDRFWPGLVSFQLPSSRANYRLQFMCAGAQSTYRLSGEDTVPAM